MTTNKPADIVPIGKYKGQPVEVLQGDPQYVEWLMGQDWVRTKYPQLFTLIVNNFGEPTETPEHNRLQAMFLDEGFRLKVFDKAHPGLRKRDNYKLRKAEIDDIKVEIKELQESRKALVDEAEVIKRDHTSLQMTDPEPPQGWSESYRAARKTLYAKDPSTLESDRQRIQKEFDVCMEALPKKLTEIDSKITNKTTEVQKIVKRPDFSADFKIKFEDKGADVEIIYARLDPDRDDLKVRIEIKPSMGDDFPAVLRTMKANHCNVLYLDAYAGIGATLEQVIKMFAASGIKVLLHKDFAAV